VLIWSAPCEWCDIVLRENCLGQKFWLKRGTLWKGCDEISYDQSCRGDSVEGGKMEKVENTVKWRECDMCSGELVGMGEKAWFEEHCQWNFMIWDQTKKIAQQRLAKHCTC